ncbi:laccase-3-like [Euphorbia lathyris]|uniref:laccase-3-like n=1 Tax=Euphorbia lathyris TaxID=212925 RepID=UPI003313609D
MYLKDSVFTISLVAMNNSPLPPYPMSSATELALHRETYQFPANKKGLVFPRCYTGWNDLVDRLELRYASVWDQVGIMDFVRSWFTYDVNMVVAEDLATGANIDESDGYLINGLPGDLYPCSQESTTYRFKVEYGKTYLLRVVNGAMNSQLFLAIAQHNLTIVGMDGSYLKPFNSSYIIVYPGNTMDILLTADQAESESDNGLYYIAARQFYSGATDYLVFDNTTVTAIIEYQGNYSTCSSKTPAFPSDTLPGGIDYVSATEFRKKFRSLYDQKESVPRNITTKMYIAEAMNEFF